MIKLMELNKKTKLNITALLAKCISDAYFTCGRKKFSSVHVCIEVVKRRSSTQFK